jgi:hypothetical protein
VRDGNWFLISGLRRESQSALLGLIGGARSASAGKHDRAELIRRTIGRSAERSDLSSQITGANVAQRNLHPS